MMPPQFPDLKAIFIFAAFGAVALALWAIYLVVWFFSHVSFH